MSQIDSIFFIFFIKTLDKCLKKLYNSIVNQSQRVIKGEKMKKEMILNHLIDVYLKEKSPISSGELKKACELPFSPSTIRNYFQKLDEEGLIVKVHISSGSIPSRDALCEYWIESLDFDNIEIDADKLPKSILQYDLFGAFRYKEEVRLENIINVNNKYIVLDFGKYEIVLRYSNELLYLFFELSGYFIDDIKKILKHVGLKNVAQKFEVGEVEFFNKEFLYKNYKNFSIEKMLDGEVFEVFPKGLSFNNDFVAYNIDAFIDQKVGEFIVVGELCNNYIGFFESIKKEA